MVVIEVKWLANCRKQAKARLGHDESDECGKELASRATPLGIALPMTTRRKERGFDGASASCIT